MIEKKIIYKKVSKTPTSVPSYRLYTRIYSLRITS